MKKRTRMAKKPHQQDQGILPEYCFEYSKARPNRFAARIKRGSRVVVIDPDVAEVFATPDAVNAVLRASIKTMPREPSRLRRGRQTNG